MVEVLDRVVTEQVGVGDNHDASASVGLDHKQWGSRWSCVWSGRGDHVGGVCDGVGNLECASAVEAGLAHTRG